MKSVPLRSKNAERKIQDLIVAELRKQGWVVKETHGNEFQAGFPDLYATHKDYGPRWIEVKNPNGYSFTVNQKKDYPLLWDNGTKIWILFGIKDIPKLFQPPNLKEFLKW